MTIKLTREENMIKITSPYNRDFIAAVKGLSAKWDAAGKTWNVPEGAEEKLMELLKDHYGYVEGAGAAMIEIEFRAVDLMDSRDDKIRIGGVVAAARDHRDSAAYTANGFYISRGSDFPRKGGSMKYPSVDAADDTYLRGKIAVAVYEELDDETKAVITVLDDNKEAQKAALEERKTELLKELAEIEEKLKNM